MTDKAAIPPDSSAQAQHHAAHDPQMSARKLRRLNTRQRKKLHVGEFQDYGFAVRIQFHQALDDLAFEGFLEAFVAMIESRPLAAYAFGGGIPLAATDGFVTAWGRGSPTEEDRQAVLQWLQARSEVSHAEVDALQAL